MGKGPGKIYYYSAVDYFGVIQRCKIFYFPGISFLGFTKKKHTFKEKDRNER